MTSTYPETATAPVDLVNYAVDEIFQFALRIEANGRAFYESLAEHFADHRELNALFTQLALEEGDHTRYFQALLERIHSYQPADSYPHEYFDYLRNLADGQVFADDAAQQARAVISTPQQALDFCMTRESTAIAYYQGMRHLVDRPEPLNEIIAEEQRHLQQLQAMKARL